MEQQTLNFELDDFELKNSPVQCLGMTFPSDEERRKYFTEKLREFLADPEFRKIEGFPIGSDQDILNLSDPPYYTACPNPWIADFIRFWEAEKSEIQVQSSKLESSKSGDSSTLNLERDNFEHSRSELLNLEPATLNYHREPFAADVSEGKNDPIYNAHSYHTKVPHKAIMRYILHYTQPGDIVFDGFCGTGMTGVAAQMCGDREVVMSLGYQVKPDGAILQEETDDDGKKVWRPFSKLGVRKAILNDLSPAATFIAYNYNTPVDVAAFEKEAKRILKEVEKKCGWMYETLHVEPASSRLLSAIDFQPCDPFQATQVKYHKDNLPHVQVAGATYFLTFRTDNFRVLQSESRALVLNAILFWDQQRWKVYSAVVMPDHVHLLAKPLEKEPGNYWDLSGLLHSVKSFSANEVNKLEDKKGTTVWQTETYDRIVRDAVELANELAYLNHNPVKAGLVEKAEDYVWRYVAPELQAAGWKPAPLGKINYTVWSDVFVCPECTHEVVFWDAAVDQEAGKVKDEFPCPHCRAELTKRRMERAWITKYDSALKQSVRQAKQVPVLINYTVGPASSRLKRFEKTPDEFDRALIDKIENSEIPYWFPTDRMMEGKETRRNDPVGITHVHHFYTKRNLWILAAIRNRCSSPQTLLWFNSQLINISKLNRYRPGVSFPYNPLSGTFYVGSQVSESSVLTAYKNKLKNLVAAFKFIKSPSIVSTKSSTNGDSISVDYLFIDPPFGANLNYSELNFLWESWLKVFTNNKPEAIENSVLGKGLTEYRQLVTTCFKEAYRVLKPGRWMTVEFSNTKASVWNSIQTALTEAGFIVANVSALDKKQGSFKAVTTPTAVKQDLVISAYKPNGGFEERFHKTVSRQDAGSTEGIWDFVRTHLKYLPVIKSGAGILPAVQKEAGILPTDLPAGQKETSQKEAGWKPALQFIPERDPRILFDQMVAYYVRKGYPVPISSQEFQIGLAQRFSERDGMYFLSDQVPEYDKKKLASGEIGTYVDTIFVHDEQTAIEWLRARLKEKPQTFSDINPQFMQQLGGWSKNEAQLDLRELLNQNFLCYDGKGPAPSQIHSYLSSNWQELRRLEAGSTQLIAKARDRWYVPDPNKAGDLEKLREKALLKEFEEYVGLASSQPTKKLKVFRLEAVRAGFKKAWQERDYAVIVAVADKIPNNVLEEDPKLLMWYDQAVTRMGGE